MTRPKRTVLIAGIVAALMIAATVPGLLGLWSDGSRVNTGAISDGRAAMLQRAGIQQVLHGHLVLRNPFLPERTPRRIVAPALVVMGGLSALLGGEAAWGILCFRLVAGAAYLLAIYALVSLILHEPTERIAAFLVAVLGAGLGWLASLLGWSAVDESMGATVFLSVVGLPQVLAGLLLQALYFVALLESFRLGRWRYAVLAGAVALVALLVDRHLLGLLFLTPLLYAAVSGAAERKFPERIVGLTLLALFVASPAVTYILLLDTPNPFQAIGPAGAPGAPAVLLGFGLVLLAAAAGAREAAVRRERLLLFPVSWLLAGAALLWAYPAGSIEALRTLPVPLGVLAGYGLMGVLRRYVLKRRAFAHASPALAIAVFILAVVPTNIVVYSRYLRDHVMAGKPDGRYSRWICGGRRGGWTGMQGRTTWCCVRRRLGQRCRAGAVCAYSSAPTWARSGTPGA